MNRNLHGGIIFLAALAACGNRPDYQAPLPFGTRSDAIVGGRTVTALDEVSRYVVGLAILDPQDRLLGTCTGTLIASDLVLTAAHCIPAAREGSLAVQFGLDLRGATTLATMRKAQATLVHESYGLQTSEEQKADDIALVRFGGGLPAGYRAARFLTNPRRLADGAPVVLAGYGVSDGRTREGSRLLRTVSVNILVAAPNPFEVDLDQSQGRGACFGDSGGPAFVKIGANHYLFGVTSRGEGVCTTDSVYTNALAYQAWLGRAAARLRAVR